MKRKAGCRLEKFAPLLAAIVAAVHPDALATYEEALSSLDYAYLQNRKVNPRDYSEPYAYHRDAFVASLLSKYAPDDDNNEDVRLQATFAKWMEAEKLCRLTNERLDPFIFKTFTVEDERLANFFSNVRKRVSTALGPVPREINGRISAKSTFKVFGERNTQIDKLCVVPELSSNAWGWLPGFAETQWYRLQKSESVALDFEIVEGNRYAVVPKKASIHRAIGVEPTLNVFYQLGVGSILKQRLRRQGLLLIPEEIDGGHYPGWKTGVESQGVHRALAKKASVDASLATIDLSSASDTVSKSLVRLLFPHEWYSLLCSLRSPKTFVDAEFLAEIDKGKAGWYELEKFSSMGNGFTFELETLIFASVVQEVAAQVGVPLETGVNFSVYGDDIIIPDALAKPVIAALKFCGFRTNTDKTFHDDFCPTGPLQPTVKWAGCFRESCGGDYFGGVNVRPISLTSLPETVNEWMTLHNQLFRWVCRYPGLSLICERIRKEQIPMNLRLGVPIELGDVGLHGVEPKFRTRYGCREVKIVVTDYFTYPLDRWDESTSYAYSLYVGRRTNVPTSDVLGHHVQWTSYG